MNTNIKWVTTDPQTNQKGRQLSPYKFQFKEDGRKETVIDLDEFKLSDIEACINRYGYTLLNDKNGNYNISKNDTPLWLIAECLFELEYKP